MAAKLIIDGAMALCAAHAMELASNAAHDGAMHDGGASRLRELMTAYRAGMEGRVPTFLEPYMAEAEHRADPEYSEFLRLQSKFGKH